MYRFPCKIFWFLVFIQQTSYPHHVYLDIQGLCTSHRWWLSGKVNNMCNYEHHGKLLVASYILQICRQHTWLFALLKFTSISPSVQQASHLFQSFWSWQHSQQTNLFSIVCPFICPLYATCNKVAATTSTTQNVFLLQWLFYCPNTITDFVWPSYWN